MSQSGSSGGLSVNSVRAIARSAVYSLVPNVLLNLSSRARNLITNPKRTILGIVVGYVVTNFINPTFNAVFGVGQTLIRGVIVLFFGSDGQVGPTGQLGLIDVPLWLATTIVSALSGPGAAFLRVITQFNTTVGQIAAQAGIAAPAVVSLLVAAEVTAVLFLLWSIIQVIDVPFVKLDGILRIVMVPINALRNFIR